MTAPRCWSLVLATTQLNFGVSPRETCSTRKYRGYVPKCTPKNLTLFFRVPRFLRDLGFIIIVALLLSYFCRLPRCRVTLAARLSSALYLLTAPCLWLPCTRLHFCITLRATSFQLQCVHSSSCCALSNVKSLFYSKRMFAGKRHFTWCCYGHWTDRYLYGT